MYSIEELSKRTNLNVNFIRKCNNLFKPILASHIQRGESNRLIFNDNALIIFDRIGQMKNNGFSIPEIKKQLNSSFQSIQTEVVKDVQRGVQSIQSKDKESLLLEKVFELQKQLSEEREKRFTNIQDKEKRIFELETLNQHLTDTLKLLPEGKSPEQIKKDWENEQEKKANTIKIVAELKHEDKGFFNLFRSKRKKLIQELEKNI